MEYEFNHTKSGVVTFGETKPIHSRLMKEREWTLGDTKVDELYEYKNLGVLKNYAGSFTSNHGLFTKWRETRSRDVWKPVSNRTPGIISKICKLGGGTPAPVCSGLLGPYKISHGLI